MALATRASDMLVLAATAAKEERQKGIDNQGAIADRMIGTLQKNRQLDILQQSANTDEQKLSIESQKLQMEKMRAEKQSELLGQFLSQGAAGSGSFPVGTTYNSKTGAFNVPLNRKLTDAESKALSSSESLQGQLQELVNIVESDKGTNPLQSSQLLGNIGPAGVTQKGQDYRLLKESISERLLRLRSGAQINESEYSRFKKMLPSIFRGDDLDIKQLKNFQEEFSNIEGRIKSGSQFDSGKKEGNASGGSDVREEYNKLRSQGVSAADAKKRLGI